MKVISKLLQWKTDALTWTNVGRLGLAVLSALVLVAVFPPVEWSVLVFVALVPWLIVVTRTSTRAQLIISYLAGLVFFFLSDLWILPITTPGYISMSLYLAVYWPAAGFLIQRLTRRWSVPLVLSFPMAWVSLEWIRSWMVTGFPWFFLGHSQVLHLHMIQIADLAGAYGVSFVVGLVNGAIAQLILSLPAGRFRQALPAGAAAALALLATIAYGHWRLGQSTTRTRLGPTISVIQDDFPLTVDGEGADVDEMFRGFLARSEEAAASKPDLIVWPETCVGAPINPEFLAARVTGKYERTEQQWGKIYCGDLRRHAKQAQSSLIVGALTRQMNPPGHYPSADKFNSALIYDAKGNYVDRYDKIRLVLFGEVVPFRYTIPRLYRFLNENMTPYGKDGFEYSLTAGTQRKRFTLTTPEGSFRYATAICYEDTMADLITQFVAPQNGRKQIDFLVNISNDGWFNHSCELLQHFYVCVFRAVENRIAVARSVNTGISGFVNPDGSIETMIKDGTRYYGPGIRGFATRQVKIDSRATVYSRIGDWPVIILTLLTVLAGILPARRVKSPPVQK